MKPYENDTHTQTEIKPKTKVMTIFNSKTNEIEMIPKYFFKKRTNTKIAKNAFKTFKLMIIK